MTLLSLILLVNAVLHGLIVGRYGVKGNEPPAVFWILYAALALVVFGGWTYALVATLTITTVGLVGLALNFKKLQHESSLEKMIFAVGAAIVVCAAYLLLIKDA
jgi:uncharacterized membrane protein YjjP (DUF1212 family)